MGRGLGPIQQQVLHVLFDHHSAGHQTGLRIAELAARCHPDGTQDRAAYDAVRAAVKALERRGLVVVDQPAGLRRRPRVRLTAAPLPLSPRTPPPAA